MNSKLNDESKRKLLTKCGAEAKFKLFEIACQMNKERFSKDLIVEIIINALKYEGLADLVRIWSEEGDAEKELVFAEIQDLIDDIRKAKLIKESR